MSTLKKNSQQKKELVQKKENKQEEPPEERLLKKVSPKLKAQHLSVEQLKKYPGLENLSDEKAREVLSFLETFAQLTFNQFTSLYGQP